MSELSKRLQKQLQEAAAKRTWKLRPEILVGPNTPKPMHGVVPREILGTKWWNATRKAAYASTDQHCVACGLHKLVSKGRQWLEAHEVYEIDYLEGKMSYVETVPLCHYCHNYVHDGRLQALLDQGKIQHAKYVAIIQHGDRIIKAAGLVRARYSGPFADWSDWRLLLEGKEYPPKFKTFEDWIKAHS